MEKDLVLIVSEKISIPDKTDTESIITTSFIIGNNEIESTLLGYIDIHYRDKFSDIQILKIIKDIFSSCRIIFNSPDYKSDDIFSTISKWLAPGQKISCPFDVVNNLSDLKYVLVVKYYTTNIDDGDIFSQIENSNIGLYVYLADNVYLNGKSDEIKIADTNAISADVNDSIEKCTMKKPFEELEEHDNGFKVLRHMINAARILTTVPNISREYAFDMFKSLIDQQNKYITDNQLIDFHKFIFTKLVKRENEQYCSFCGKLSINPNSETIQIGETHYGCTLKEIVELIGYGVSIDRQQNTITIFSCEKHSEDLSKVAIAAETGKFSLNEILLRRSTDHDPTK